MNKILTILLFISITTILVIGLTSYENKKNTIKLDTKTEIPNTIDTQNTIKNQITNPIVENITPATNSNPTSTIQHPNPTIPKNAGEEGESEDEFEDD